MIRKGGLANGQVAKECAWSRGQSHALRRAKKGRRCIDMAGFRLKHRLDQQISRLKADRIE